MQDARTHQTSVHDAVAAKDEPGISLRFPRQPILLEPITEETNALVEMRDARLLAVEGEPQRANEGRQAGGRFFCCANCARHAGVTSVKDRAAEAA